MINNNNNNNNNNCYDNNDDDTNICPGGSAHWNGFQGDPEKEYWGTYVSRSYSLSHYTSTG